ncbi:molybdate ABC transporter substrate-binding protein [Frigoribacterium faeni]|uniref:Molybdate transport system substrate-binding protein n=1 Tax=Frigoribacterium faeni TaxID=145483 RepID=A0A7W3PJJ9_9MICO|nr:molybdate ABC transporter substrate-binding protein [Frigoribacterium faeni]MBA8813839.1 molybdate transport system substrate-binding protein [Frigoribacterium faeni]GEK82186.1 molybdate-binding protein [Frigoribacterium faeni]
MTRPSAPRSDRRSTGRSAARRSAFRAAPLLASVALVGLALAGCASGGGADAPPGNTDTAAGTPVAGQLSGDITVFAAASLKGTFTQLASDFEVANPSASVELTFAGSSDLVTQITEGAPADVFASADTKNMTKVTDADLAEGDPVDFATNVLEIAVPPGNPAGVADLADLADPDVALVVCAPAVPCGSATVAVEEAAGITLSPVSEESSVTDVLGKVTSGEADAGLVYVTDVAAAGDAVEGIEFDESSEAVNTYPIVALKDSDSADVAQAFVDYVTSAAGQDVLSAAGFGAP